MTRKKKAVPDSPQIHPQTTGNSRTSEVRWVNPSLNSEDIEWLEHNGDDALGDLVELIEGIQSDSRLSCKYEAKSTRWQAILFDDSHPEGTPTPALSVRGGSALDALLVLAYCALRKYPDGWADAVSVPTSRFGQ